MSTADNNGTVKVRLVKGLRGTQAKHRLSVKALEAGGAISRETDPAGVAGFLLWGSVPEPFTIRKAVRALAASS